MPTELAIAFSLLAMLVIGVLVYTVIRLYRESPPPNADPRAQRLTRFAGFPSLFDGLLARPMTRREKLGWIIFGVVLMLAVSLTGGGQ